MNMVSAITVTKAENGTNVAQMNCDIKNYMYVQYQSFFPLF